MGPFKVFLDHPNEKSVTATNINLDLFTSEPHFVFQISFLPNIAQKWFCMQNLRSDLSFQEKKTVCKSVTWFISYNNYCDEREFRSFFLNAL